MGEVFSCTHCANCEGASTNSLDDFLSCMPIRSVSPAYYADTLHDFKRTGSSKIDRTIYHERIFKPLLINPNYSESLSSGFFYTAWDQQASKGKSIEFLAAVALLTNVCQTDYIKFSPRSITNALRGILEDYALESHNVSEYGRYLIAYHYIRDILEAYFHLVSHHALEYLYKEIPNGASLRDLYLDAFKPNILELYLDRLFQKFLPRMDDKKPEQSYGRFLIDLEKFFEYHNKNLWDDMVIRENLLNEHKLWIERAKQG